MKKSSNLRIALDHACFVVVIISILRSDIAKNLLIYALGTKEALVFLLSPTGVIFNYLLIILGILAGIFLSKNILEKRYFIDIENKNKIIKFSTILFVLIISIYNLFIIFITSGLVKLEFNIIENTIILAIMAVLFYLLSQKLIKPTEMTSEITEQIAVESKKDTKLNNITTIIFAFIILVMFFQIIENRTNIIRQESEAEKVIQRIKQNIQSNNNTALDKNLVFSYSIWSKPAIKDNDIQNLWLDSNSGYLYVSTLSGLFVIDSKSTKDFNDDETIITYTEKSTPSTISTYVHSSWLNDDTGYLYVSTAYGLSVVDTKKTKELNDDESVITYSKKSNPAIPDNFVNSSWIDNNTGYLYINLGGDIGDNGGLSVIDTKKTKNTSDDELIITYSNNFNPAIRLNKFSYSWLDSNTGYLYASAIGSGLAVIDTKNTKDVSDDKLLFMYSKDSSPSIGSYNPYRTWLDNETGYLYIGTIDNGLVIVDTQKTKEINDDKLITTYGKKSPVTSSFLLDKKTGYLYIAKTGIVDKSFSVVDTKNTKDVSDDKEIKNYSFKNVRISDFWLDENSDYLYIGTDEGVKVVDINL